MGKCKTKAIQTDLGIFRHNQKYPGIIQPYLEPCVTLAYSEPWYIQNPDTFRIRCIFKTLGYSQPCYIQNPSIYSELWHIQNPRHIQNPAKHLQ